MRKLACQLGYRQARLAGRPDLTVPGFADELARERGISVAPASVSRFLCRNAIIYEKGADRREATSPGRRGGAP